MEELNLAQVEQLIWVRNEPHIYAFSTNTIPNYLKVGDTFRAVDIRIEEWSKKISAALQQKVNLKKEWMHSAQIENAYFRDYSIHAFLTNELGKKSLEETNPQLLSVYSREFFEGVQVSDVEKAVVDIQNDYKSDNPNKKYSYYNLADTKPANFHWVHDQEWELRPNQRQVVDDFLCKYKKKKVLLMYAVMRFGKSFTAMMCAREMNAEKVLVVSAKADVATEWKATVEKPRCFKDYAFLLDTDFERNPDEIKNTLSSGKRAVTFLTLQNLSGKNQDGKNIKKKLEKVFKTKFDLIIVDETHFGAWAKSYGASLKDDEDVKSVREDVKIRAELEEQLQKTLKAKYKLHLSGTPYNLLYDKKFDEDNMIAAIQFSDILSEKEKWDSSHFADIENGVVNQATGEPYQEYDNPYFGFPRMLRFAFNPTQEMRARLAALAHDGKWSLSEMFFASSGRFKHEADVLKLLKIMDGSDSAEGILSFLNLPKIKDNDVCKHLVMVLPRKSSCDAMAQLLSDYANEFINFSNYKVLNVAGHNAPREFDKVENVKSTVSACEKLGEKTITLTVNKMLTGVTVKEWDTMIMLKTTHSAQEYDQAIFRIQNQYVIEYEDAITKCVIKKDMKPQTILVDFDPLRVFEIQGRSSNISSEISKTGESFEKSIQKDLKYFPIVTYNGKKLVKVEPTNIVELITQYNNQKSILEEATDVQLDTDILNDTYITKFIEAQSKTGLTNKLTTDAHKGDSSEMEICEGDDSDEDYSDSIESNIREDKKDDTKELEKKFRMCLANILFYVFLSNSKIENLADVVSSLKDKMEGKRNRRIFNHLNLDKKFIKALKDQARTAFAIEINHKIKNANLLSKDENLSPEHRALNALNRFSRISDSEIVTPIKICNEMLDCIGEEELKVMVERGDKILDIAAKTGEFAYAIYQRLKNTVDQEKLVNAICSIPTSGVTYEFTRRMYEILGLNLDNLIDSDKMNSYGLLEIKTSGKINHRKIANAIKKKFSQGGRKVNFAAVIGNPPYHIEDGGAQASAKPIYQEYVTVGKKVEPSKMALIMPTRWYAGGKGLDDFRTEMLHDETIVELHDYLHPEAVFPDTNNRVGVCHILWDAHFNNQNKAVRVVTHTKNDIETVERGMKYKDLDIFVRHSKSLTIIDKIVETCGDKVMSPHVSPRRPFGLSADIIKTSTYKTTKAGMKNPVACLSKGGSTGFIEYEDVVNHKEWIMKWKVFTPRANNIGTELNDDNLNTFIGYDEICTESYIVIGVNLELDELSAKNLSRYLQTKFARFCHGLAKASHDATAKTYRFVPLQDFTENSDINWNVSIPEIDQQLYQKYNLTESEIAFIEEKIKPME